VAVEALAAEALAPGEEPDHARRWWTETNMRRPRRVSRGTAGKGRSTGRRRGKDVSNSSRLLATVDGELAYFGRVRGANGDCWKVT
jgi:hypothetical protein